MSSTNNPLVTILIPTHNRAHFLVDALNSALTQNYDNLEILVLDNESTDNTGEVIKRYLDDPRIRYVRHEVNLGITGNWRYGITATKGQFFCLLHDDDTFEPSFVRSLLHPLIDNHSLALAFCDQWVMDVNKVRRPEKNLSKDFCREGLSEGPLEDFARAVLVDYAVPVGASLFRREAVSHEFIDDRAKGAIDYWLLYRILETGRGAYYVDKKLMNYRVHGGGMSSSATTYMAEGHLFRFRAALTNPTFSRWHPQVLARRRETLTGYGIDLVQAGRRAEAKRALVQVLRQRPNARACTAFLLACLGPVASKIVGRLRANLRGQKK